MPIDLSNKQDVQNVLNKLESSFSDYSIADSTGPKLNKLIDDFEELDFLVAAEDNAGIQDIFVLMYENLIELQINNSSLNQSQSYLFQCWLRDVHSLLSENVSNKKIESLINIAMHYDWPLPLAKDDAVVLAEMLDIDVDIHTGAEESNLLEMTMAVDKNSLLEKIEHSSSQESKSSEEPEENIISEPGDELDDAAALIKEIEHELNHYPLSAFPTPNAYIISEKLLLLSDYFLAEDLSPLNDLCMLVAENLNDIYEDKAYLNQSQQYLLHCFLRHLQDYLNNTNNVDLLQPLTQVLTHYDWPTPISKEDISILFDMAGGENKDLESVSSSNDELVNVDDASAVPVSILDNLELFSDLLSRYSGDANNIINVLKELSSKFMAEENFAILDVIGLVEENISDLHEQEDNLTAEHVSLLFEWKDLMLNYLAEPKHDETIKNILAILQKESWLTPLSKEDADVIAEMFGVNVEEQTDYHEVDNNTDVSVEEDQNEVSMLERLSVAEAAVEEITTAKRTPISNDLVEMLIVEMQQMQEELQETLSAVNQSSDVDDFSQPISQYAERILRFGNACQAADMPGLYQVSNLMKENLSKLAQEQQQFSPEQKELLTQWPQLILSYLNSLGDEGKSRDITSVLLNNTWADPLLSEVSPALIDLLSAPYIAGAEEIVKTARIKNATDQDVSISLPEDINAELLEGLLIELPGQIEELTEAVQSLSDGSGSMLEMEKAQRVVHTIKGAANTVGIKGIATLTHNFEDILVALCEYKQLPTAELNDSMMDAADCLQEMYESLSVAGATPANAKNVLQSILDWANLIEEKGAEVLEQEVLKEKESVEEKIETQKQEQSDSTLRVSTGLIDEILRLLSESIINTSQLQDRLSNTEKESESLLEQNSTAQKLIVELEQQVELRGVAFNKQAVVNSSDDIFDPLEFEQYNELNTVANRLVESANDSKVLGVDLQHNIADLNELLIKQTRTHRQLQELVMRSRMLPVKTLTPRLQRCVRQASRHTHKKVSLTLSGTDTLIDRDVADIILDPLMHILRNSVDHSIEDADTRVSKNKKASGHVSVDFVLDGANILITCSDDGAGFDYAAIHNTAIEKGLLKPEQDISNKELNALLMQPGFSTKKDVTQISGRGVGMDIVRAQIMSVKGTINIDSKAGEGSTIELRIPASLLSNHGMLIEQNDTLYAVANRGIEKIVHINQGDIIKKDDDFICIIDDKEYKVKDMQSLLRLPERADKPLENYAAGIIIKDEEIEELVVYDRFIKNMDFIIKNMGQYLKEIRGVRGATILGNGDVAPVLDLPDLIRASSEKLTPFSGANNALKKVELPLVLVVDDSLSARRALINIASDAGYEVLSAQDGLDAAEIINNKKKPDILLLDMEMPRMNGLELTSHIRSNESSAHIPIIMITSRTTDKHKEQALSSGVNMYFSKPFQEDELLDAMHNLLS